MTVPAAHASRFVYHTTHIENLPNILRHGLLSYNEQSRRGLQHHSIAAPGIQARRATMTVTCAPGGVVHDYVPLYFTKRSPMMLSQVQAKNVDQFLLLHFAFPISLVERADTVFTDAAANSLTPPSFFSDPAALANLSWPAIDLRSWHSRVNGIEQKHERMAEALVHNSLDPASATHISLWNDGIKQEVIRLYAAAGLASPELRFDSSYDSHSFTHFRSGLPADMLNTSIASGPMATGQRFERTVTNIAALRALARSPRYGSLIELLQALRTHGLGALPETAELLNLQSENEVHREDVGDHTMRVVELLRTSPEFASLAPDDKPIVELAAYLHDIGKGPKSRWAGCGGKQQVDHDHPIRSMEMLPRILSQEVNAATEESMRRLCKLVCYHDLIGDIVGRGRDRQQMVNVGQTRRDVDCLIALGKADMSSVAAGWAHTANVQLPSIRAWVFGQLAT